MDIKIIMADYSNAQQGRDIAYLLDSYASDPMGGGAALEAGIKSIISAELAKVPGAFSVLCYVDKKPVGLANCFMGFSTFKCKPIVNIHDLAVISEFRGMGISRRLLEAVEMRAKERECCKITLEVLDGNVAAKCAYSNYGFSGYELDPAAGQALFWEKLL